MAITTIHTTHGSLHGNAHIDSVRGIATKPLVNAVGVSTMAAMLAEEEPLPERNCVVVQLLLLR